MSEIKLCIQKLIDNEPKDNIPKYLKKFVDDAAQCFQFPELNSDNKRKRLWENLFNLAKNTEDKEILTNVFIAIRILSREKADLNELITPEWLELIQIHSGLNNSDFDFNPKNLLLAIEVGKSLCNVAFNSTAAADNCCKNGILDQLSRRLNKNVPYEMKFFDVKLVFILTALCPWARKTVKSEMGGVTSLIQVMDSILKEAAIQSIPDPICLDDQKVDLACEVLKALFNVTLNSYGVEPNEKEQCTQLVSMLRLYLLVLVKSKEKRLDLQSNIINLLTNIPNNNYKDLMTAVVSGQNLSNKLQFEGQNLSAFNEILNFLKSRFSVDIGVSKQHEILSPVITVLFKSARSERIIRKYIRLQILPPLKDVHNRPEEGSTLRNHLCRLLTSPITQLRDLIAELLFILCKKNVNRMVKYTGYGNAAGLFAQRGLLGGRRDSEEAEFSSESEDSETEEYAEFKHGINPVVGCYEKPHANPMENMTEEQKEYEAMKLVELMDSLTKCGAIQPCRVGPDGKPHPISHVLQLQEGLKSQQVHNESDSD